MDFFFFNKEKRLIVPKWTKDWYQNRREGKYSEDGDQSLYRKCIRSLWFFGQDWEFFYTLKHILDVIDSSKWSSDEDVWRQLVKKYNYYTNEKYRKIRMGLVLNVLALSGLIERNSNGEVRKTKTGKGFPIFKNEYCPINRAETIHKGKVLEWSRDNGIISNEEFEVLERELFRFWSIASNHIETRTATIGGSTRSNKGPFNNAMCGLQELIWSGRYDTNYQSHKDRKKSEHRLNRTVWPAYRVTDLITYTGPPRWNKNTWKL